VEDAGAAPVLYERVLKSSKKNKAGKKTGKKTGKKASEEKADVCDGNVDMDVNNALMFVMNMENMDDVEAATINILAPAVEAVRFFMVEQGGGDTSNVTDDDIVESMLSPFTGDATRNLQETKTLDRQAPTHLTRSQQATWSMAYYSFSVILMNAGYTPDSDTEHFNFAKVVADYISSSSESADVLARSYEIAIVADTDQVTAVYYQFASIFNLLGIGKQLELARRQDALGPLSSDADISRLCGKLIAAFNVGARTTQSTSNERLARGESTYNGAVAEFAASMCKLRNQAGTRLTIHGSGFRFGAGTSTTTDDIGSGIFDNGSLVFTGAPIGTKLFIRSYGTPADPTSINRMTFESCTATAHSTQTFYSLNEFDSFSFYAHTSGGTGWNHVMFNPSSPGLPNTVVIGDGPSSPSGGNRAAVLGTSSGQPFLETSYYAPNGPDPWKACENAIPSFMCHSFTRSQAITEFRFNSNTATNFRGFSLNNGGELNGDIPANIRFFFRYGNIGFNPANGMAGEGNLVPAVGTGDKKWVYEETSATF
jgi:hypothetical protein